jgi:hypothetical protein
MKWPLAGTTSAMRLGAIRRNEIAAGSREYTAEL